MRNRIIGGIGVVWGAGIVVYGLFIQERAGGAYGAGQIAGVVFGAVMLIAGLAYLIKGDSPEEKPPRDHRRKRPGKGE